MSLQLAPDKLLEFKIRQIALGPTPTAAYERLASVGNVLEAQTAHPNVDSAPIWLVNFKL